MKSDKKVCYNLEIDNEGFQFSSRQKKDKSKGRVDYNTNHIIRLCKVTNQGPVNIAEVEEVNVDEEDMFRDTGEGLQDVHLVIQYQIQSSRTGKIEREYYFYIVQNCTRTAGRGTYTDYPGLPLNNPTFFLYKKINQDLQLKKDEIRARRQAALAEAAAEKEMGELQQQQRADAEYEDPNRVEPSYLG